MRLLFSLIFIGLFFCTAKAQVKWDGGGDGFSWNDATNWVGDIVPGTSDDVLLDNSILSGTYTVFLPTSSVMIRSLTLTPNPATFITLQLPFSNTLSSNAFVTTGTGYTVTINSGGAFDNSANVSFGTNLTIADSIRIANGGYYFHRTKSDVLGWIKRLSRALGTETGVFAFDVPYDDYTLSVDVDGLVFGALNFSSGTNALPVNYTIQGIGSLVVRSIFNITDYTSVHVNMSNDLILHDILMFLDAVFDLQSASNTNVVKSSGNIYCYGGLITETGNGTPQLLFNGTTPQNITLAGSITNNVEFHVSKPSGNAVLQTPIILPYKLTLTKGKIITTSANILTLADNATSSGGSSLSFVQGPMRKAGNDDFVFPIGTGAMYTPIGMYNVSGQLVTDTFTAEYKRSNPQSTYGVGVNTADLNHVSYVEYWKLTQDHGSATKNISLAVHGASFCKNLEHTYICRWDGTIWNKETTNFPPPAINGNYETGIITTANGLSGFTAPNSNVFTLGTDLNFILNPLPVNLVAFGARKISDTKSLIEWELAECCSDAVKFEVERAEDNRPFKKIHLISGNEIDRFYSVADNNPASGVNYYRLKIIDENGLVMYSKTVTVINGAKGLMMGLAPTVANDKVTLTLSSANNRQLDIYITDIQGKVVRTVRQQIPSSNSNISVMVSDLTAGMYYIIAVAGNEKTNTLRFIKK